MLIPTTTGTQSSEEGKRSSSRLEEDVNHFFRDALKLETPVSFIIHPKTIASTIFTMSPNERMQHEEFMNNILATKASSLWPTTNKPPENCNIASIWNALHVHLPALEPTPIVETTKQTTRTTKVHTTGRKRGSQNWKKNETLHLLDCIEQRKPFENEHWEQIETDMCNAGFPARDANACKLKFEKLWQAKQMTGRDGPWSSYLLQRAKMLKDTISAHSAIAPNMKEFVNNSMEEDSDSSDNDSSPNNKKKKNKLIKKDGPTRKRKRRIELTERLEQHSKRVAKYNQAFNGTLIKFVDILGKDNKTTTETNNTETSIDRKEFDEFKTQIISKLDSLESITRTILTKLENKE